jgi:hypothetical protein
MAGFLQIAAQEEGNGPQIDPSCNRRMVWPRGRAALLGTLQARHEGGDLLIELVYLPIRGGKWRHPTFKSVTAVCGR